MAKQAPAKRQLMNPTQIATVFTKYFDTESIKAIANVITFITKSIIRSLRIFITAFMISYMYYKCNVFVEIPINIKYTIRDEFLKIGR